MKKLFSLLGLLSILLSGCAAQETADIAATTLPVWEFTAALCQDTGLSVTRLVTESVSCLHDYSLNVRQVKAAEAANCIVISGGGLEEFMSDLLDGKVTVDASSGIALLEGCHDHDHQGHHHEADSHIWLSPANALQMARNICKGLSETYPRHATKFSENLTALEAKIQAVQAYGDTQLSGLSSRKLITFHDGFAYFAQAFDLEIVKAIEEESGAEASAAELKEIVALVRSQDLPAIFTETNGSTSAAAIISAETGVPCFSLDMAMAGESWFDAMYRNIDTLKEALQ